MFLVRTSQCTVHSSTAMPWLKVQGISVAHFSKTLSGLRHILVRCVFHSFTSLSLHLLLVLCHDLQRHRHHWRGPDQLPAPLLTGVACLAAWPIQLHTHKDESGVQEMTNPDQAAKGEPKGGRQKRSKQPSCRGVDLPSLARGKRFTLARVHLSLVTCQECCNCVVLSSFLRVDRT